MRMGFLFSVTPMPSTPPAEVITVPPPAAGQPPLRVRAVPDARRERIGVRRQLVPLEATGRAIDDLTRDFGPDLYRDMQHDPQVRAGLQLPLRAVLTQPWQIVPAIDGRAAPATDADFAQADRVARFGSRMLARLIAPPLPSTLYELGQALAEGHRVGELVWDVATLDPADGPQQVITAIKPRPNQNVAFVVDVFNNCYGVRYASPTGGVPTGPLVVGPDGRIPDFLTRDQVIIATWDPQNGDPRGQSLLRAAYNGWWFRTQVWPEWLAWLATMASPTIVGTLSENAEDETTDDEGNPLPVPIKAIDKLVTILEMVKNRGILALPFGYTATLLQQQGAGATGDPFTAALDYGAREIWMGLTGQTRATQEAQYGSKADSGTAENQLDMHEAWLATWLETLVRTDLLAPCVVRNYGLEALRFLPLVSFGDTAPQDVPDRTRAAASAGYRLHWSQFPAIDSALGWGQRDMEAMAEEREAMAALTQGQAPGGTDETDDAGNPDDTADADGSDGGGSRGADRRNGRPNGSGPGGSRRRAGGPQGGGQ